MNIKLFNPASAECAATELARLPVDAQEIVSKPKEIMDKVSNSLFYKPFLKKMAIF